MWPLGPFCGHYNLHCTVFFHRFPLSLVGISGHVVQEYFRFSSDAFTSSENRSAMVASTPLLLHSPCVPIPRFVFVLAWSCLWLRRRRWGLVCGRWRCTWLPVGSRRCRWSSTHSLEISSSRCGGGIGGRFGRRRDSGSGGGSRGRRISCCWLRQYYSCRRRSAHWRRPLAVILTC